jgi:SHS2 domain-containing protein
MASFGSETFEHIADVGVRGWGRTVEDAFIGGAEAMLGVMFDTSKVEGRREVDIECGADDLEALFVEWLNALLTKRDLEGMVFVKFEVRIEDGPEDGDDAKVLHGKAFGDAFDPEVHDVRTEVKAATYSQLKVGRDADGRFVAQCIVDV